MSWAYMNKQGFPYDTRYGVTIEQVNIARKRLVNPDGTFNPLDAKKYWLMIGQEAEAQLILSEDPINEDEREELRESADDLWYESLIYKVLYKMHSSEEWKPTSAEVTGYPV